MLDQALVDRSCPSTLSFDFSLAAIGAGRVAGGNPLAARACAQRAEITTKKDLYFLKIYRCSNVEVAPWRWI
jgi:hypothetical protein